jgi:hypothetical protein
VKVFFQDVETCFVVSRKALGRRTVACGAPSPTRNCHSGPVGFVRVLLVSIMGTTPVIEPPYWLPPGYRGGGGSTLYRVSMIMDEVSDVQCVLEDVQHRARWWLSYLHGLLDEGRSVGRI